MRISFVVRRIDTLIHKRKLSNLLYECWNCFQNILKMKISLRVLVLKHRLTQTSIQFFLPDSLPQNPAYNLHSSFASNLNLKFYFPTLLQCAYPLVFLLTPFKLIIPLSYIGCALTNESMKGRKRTCFQFSDLVVHPNQVNCGNAIAEK